MFRVHGSNLELVDRKATGGSEPNAVAQHGGLVYVLNVGGSSNVISVPGLHAGGELRRIPNSIRFLTTNNSEGASLAFSPDRQAPDRQWLRPKHKISFFRPSRRHVSIDRCQFGSGARHVCAYFRTQWYGSDLRNRTSRWQQRFYRLFVLNTCEWNTFCNQYRSPDAGKCKLLECCCSKRTLGLRLERRLLDNRRISIGTSGGLTPIGATIVGINPAGSGNLDIAISSDSKFLYSLNSGNGTIGVFGIQEDGTLLNVAQAEGISAKAGFNGIAAF